MHVRLVKQISDGSFRELVQNISPEYEFNLPKSIQGRQHWEVLGDVILHTGFVLEPYPPEWNASRDMFLNTMRDALENIVGKENMPPEHGENNVMVDDTDDDDIPIPSPFLDTAIRGLIPSPNAAASELTMSELPSPMSENHTRHSAEDELLRFLHEAISSDDVMTIASALHEPSPSPEHDDMINLYDLIDSNFV